MTRATEYEVLQNVALGAIALRSFVEGFSDVTEPSRGPTLPLLLPVLPIVFHQESVYSLATRQFTGGLFRALSENRALPAGLQHRMQSMVGQTFASLRAGCAARLLVYNRQTTIVSLTNRTVPPEIQSGGNKLLLMTARRLGRWFAETPPAQLRILLELRF